MNASSDPVQLFVVLLNRTGRASCWPIERTIPGGWTSTTIRGTKQHCLDRIRNLNSDVTTNSPSGDPFGMSFMFFGGSDDKVGGDKYRLLFESAQFADRHGFRGLWLPERHFTDFGCLYPDPAVLHAALARETRNLRLRAGSVVLPLNDPIRVAEQWSIVDNLSDGRVEIAFASGWHVDDFALMPTAYDNRAEHMQVGINEVQSLWRGETVERRNGTDDRVNIRIYPTPIQGELPTWLTAAGNPKTFRLAGELGCGVLTHLFNQDISGLRESIGIYHSALRESGYDVSDARVAVALHTFVAETLDVVREKARESYCRYMKSNLGLLKQLAFSQGQSSEIDSLGAEELDQLLGWLFEKFVGGRSLLGTVASCVETCQELAKIGVNEVACLLDFGPDPNEVVSHLRFLSEVNRATSTLAVGR